MSITRLSFSAATGPVTLAVAVREALPVASSVFPDDRCADPGGAPDLSVEHDGSGFVLRTARGRWRSPELDGVLVQMELTLAEELVRRSGLRGMHAGGVVLGDRAVLLPGEGGRGKSSLTAALALRGLPVLGDDVVLLDEAGWAHPFRRLLKLEEPARSILSLPPSPAPLAEAWSDASFYRPRDLGSRWADPAPVGAVVIPERIEGTAARLVSRRPSELLPGLLAAVVLSDRIAAGAFDAVSAALAGASCWSLRYGSTPEGAEAIIDALA